MFFCSGFVDRYWFVLKLFKVLTFENKGTLMSKNWVIEVDLLLQIVYSRSYECSLCITVAYKNTLLCFIYPNKCQVYLQNLKVVLFLLLSMTLCRITRFYVGHNNIFIKLLNCSIDNGLQYVKHSIGLF